MIPIIISIVLGFAILGIQIWMNIKIKFAKTQQEAMSHAKTLVINLISFLGVGIGLYLLYNELNSPSILDKKSLYRILLISFSLATVFFTWFMFALLSMIGDFLRHYEKHLKESHKNNNDDKEQSKL